MKAFHEWGKVEDVGETLPTFTTSDIGHFFIVAEVAADLGGNEHEEEGELLPHSQPCEGGQGAVEVLLADRTRNRLSRQSLGKTTNRKADFRK